MLGTPGSHGQCRSVRSMKGDVKGKSSPSTGKFYERGCQGKKFSLDWEVGVFGPDLQPLVAPATNVVNGALDLRSSCVRAQPRAWRERLGIHRLFVTTSESS